MLALPCYRLEAGGEARAAACGDHLVSFVTRPVLVCRFSRPQLERTGSQANRRQLSCMHCMELIHIPIA